MSVTSSDHARRPYTRCRSCARTTCVTRRCRPSSGQSPSPSCSTHPVPGLEDSPKRLIGSESMDSYDAASAVATVRQTLLHLPNSVRLWMNNYLITFVITRITYCTVSFIHPQQPHKTTIWNVVFLSWAHWLLSAYTTTALWSLLNDLRQARSLHYVLIRQLVYITRQHNGCCREIAAQLLH